MKRLMIFIAVLIGLGMAQAATADPYKPIVYTKVTMLSWTAPTENTDGTPLTDLAGFKVYCSSVAGQFGDPTSHLISDPLATSILLKDVPCVAFGDNYFAMTAVNAGGLESEYSIGGYAKKLAGSFSSDSFAADVTVPNASVMNPVIK
jgi:hypothetical protein